MATENKVLDLTFPAGEDLTNDQYRFVVLTSSGTVRRPDSASEVAIGILQNAPASGEAAVVRLVGVSKVQANDAIGIGTFIGPEYVDATDAGKAQDNSLNLAYARAIMTEATTAEDDLGSCLILGIVPAIADTVQRFTTVTTKTTAGNVTYTASELIGGLILRDPNGASRSDVTPTAAQIVAGLTGAIATSSFAFTIRNTADAAETITLTAGTNVTLSGTMTIPQNYSRQFLAVVTNAGSGTEAVTIYSLGIIQDTVQKVATVATIDTNDAVTYTAAQLLGGLILRDPNGGARSDVTPTAANIVAAIPGAIVGSGFEFTIRNTADGNETITVTAGTGVTLSGTMTIAQNYSRRFLAVLTNVGSGTEAATIYSLGTVAH